MKYKIHREGQNIIFVLLFILLVINIPAYLFIEWKVIPVIFIVISSIFFLLVVNFFRSIPFIVLMVSMLPVAKFIVGSSLGNAAMIVMLVIAAAPYIARMVESSLKEVDAGVIEAAQAMGCSNLQIVCKVLLPEAKPSLITGGIISMVTILGYSAMAATIGGTGLGQIAIVYGHQRSKPDVTWVCVLLLVLIVQIIQAVGNVIVHRSDKRIRQ